MRRPARYELDGHSPFALGVDRPTVEVARLDGMERRLVDATLVIVDELAPAPSQTGWDRASLPAVVGAHAIVVRADSLDETRLAIERVDAIDRIESVQLGERTCFHAYAGGTEVATAMTITGGTLDPTATNCAIGATRVEALGIVTTR